jgi:peptidoglycan/xylan/chitin deacetylase (PgdA/CDA1 family)
MSPIVFLAAVAYAWLSAGASGVGRRSARATNGTNRAPWGNRHGTTTAVSALAIVASVVLSACGLSPAGTGGPAGPEQRAPSATEAEIAQVPTMEAPSPRPSVALAEPSASPSPASPLPAYVSHGSRNRKWIALTFDADMYRWMYAERDRVSEVDLRIVDLLEQTHTPATIFVNGLFVRAYPNLVKRLADDPGIELANHSWDHAGWTRNCPNSTPIQPPMTKRTEVTKTEAIVKDVTGVEIQYFRFPGFCHATSDVTLVRSLGEYSIGSDCFFGDTYGWSAQRQVASVERGCTSGSIVVTHLNGPPYHANVYEALKILIPWWKKHGWTIVSVGQMLGHPTP